jgi:hypothetical protein
LDVVNRDGGLISNIEVELQWNLDKVKKKPYSGPRYFQFVAILAIYLPSHWTISHLDDYVSGKNASVMDEVNKHLDYWLEVGNFEEGGDISKWMGSGDGKHLHAMIIEKHSDASHRLGIASVSLGPWLRSDPKLEDIVSENLYSIIYN